MVRYAVRLATRYDGLVLASFPDLPGVTALGRDDDEALSEARRALEAALREQADAGLAPPEPLARGETMIETEFLIPLAAA